MCSLAGRVPLGTSLNRDLLFDKFASGGKRRPELFLSGSAGTNCDGPIRPSCCIRCLARWWRRRYRHCLALPPAVAPHDIALGCYRSVAGRGAPALLVLRLRHRPTLSLVTRVTALYGIALECGCVACPAFRPRRCLALGGARPASSRHCLRGRGHTYRHCLGVVRRRGPTGVAGASSLA